MKEEKAIIWARPRTGSECSSDPHFFHWTRNIVWPCFFDELIKFYCGVSFKEEQEVTFYSMQIWRM